MDLYIVVCTDLHQALGPMGREVAVKFARKMTDGGGCVYLPVKLNLTSNVVLYPDKQDRPVEDTWPRGQYL